jgi:hypothetical protein
LSTGLLLVAWLATSAAHADDPHHPLCRLFLHEDQREREDRELALALARQDLAAREEIFALLEALWKIQGVERLVYVTGKHARDRAKIEVERLRLDLESYDAHLEQYRTYCAALAAGRSPNAAESETIARAWARYLQSECDSIGQERSAAEIDLAYEREVLTSVQELRAGEVATRPDVILAELEVRRAQDRLDHARRRFDRCHTPP